jgi:C1A family cysteine protease
MSRVSKASGGRVKLAPPAKLPTKVDLRDKCPAIEDQGEIGSCTAHAVGGLLEYLWKQTTESGLDGSRLFLYKATRNLLGWTGDTGAFVRTAIKAARLFGVCPEDWWPYEDEKFDEEPPAFCYSLAQNFKTLVYYRLDAEIPKLKASLAQGIPFAFGFTCFETIDDPEVAETGRIPFPAKNETTVGGHAVMAVGYDDTEKSFIIRNSWGRTWGDPNCRGYGYIPYKYFDTDLADDCWCVLKVNIEDVSDVG